MDINDERTEDDKEEREGIEISKSVFNSLGLGLTPRFLIINDLPTLEVEYWVFVCPTPTLTVEEIWYGVK